VGAQGDPNDFRLQPSDLTAASEGFSGDRSVASDLASTLNGARTVDTGDASLDGRIESGMGEGATVLEKLSMVLAQNAKGLTAMVDNYNGAERMLAGRFDSIRQGGSPSDATSTPSEDTPQASLGIVEKLSG
jgi:hypothetical protein